MLRSCARPPRRCLRAQEVKAADRPLHELAAGLDVTPVPWCGSGFSVNVTENEEDSKLGHSRANITGQIYIQEATSMLPVEALQKAWALVTGETGGKPGRREPQVLDLCAAPGSKATQLAAWVDSQGGVLVANEPDPGRWKQLRSSLLRAGSENCILTRIDGCEVGRLAPSAFDLVLLDTPCSCEGNIRKDSTVFERWSAKDTEAKLEPLLDLQRKLIMSSWEALRPGGVLVYSTCTWNAAEDEEQCSWLLEQQPDAELMDLGRLLDLPPEAVKDGCARIWPQLFDTEGFFVSCFRKAETEVQRQPRPLEDVGSRLGAALLPLKEVDVQRLKDRVEQKLGFWPASSGHLAQDTTGAVWLCPPQARGLGRLTSTASPEPGLCVAVQAPGSPDELVPSDELLLYAGERATLAAQGMSAKAWAALLARVEGSLATWNAQLAAAARTGDVRNAQDLLVQANQRQLRTDVITHSTVVHAHAQARDPEGAREALQAMREELIQPNVVAYTSLISAYTRAGDLERAAQVLEEMRLERVPPNAVTFNALMSGYAKRSDADATQRILQSMQQWRVPPNTNSWNALLQAYTSADDVVKATKVLRDMLQSRVQPDNASFNTVLLAYVRAGVSDQSQQVLEVVECMREQRVAPNRSTQTILSRLAELSE